MIMTMMWKSSIHHSNWCVLYVRHCMYIYIFFQKQHLKDWRFCKKNTSQKVCNILVLQKMIISGNPHGSNASKTSGFYVTNLAQLYPLCFVPEQQLLINLGNVSRNWIWNLRYKNVLSNFSYKILFQGNNRGNWNDSLFILSI